MTTINKNESSVCVYVFSGLTDEVPPVHIYPRLCVIHWSDHNHAAFYPPLDLSYTVDDPFRYYSQLSGESKTRNIYSPHH